MRHINEIIIHCSATLPALDVSVSDIDRWHRERGFSGIGYHYVVYRNGSIVEGRPMERIGAHCEGHNANSIGICYIGGLDEKTGKPKDTRTKEQKEAILNLLRNLTGKLPIGKITGHNQYANKACPCFDAQMEYDGMIDITAR
jgi:N-acetylmuramoyl-L-alanine amidase